MRKRDKNSPRTSTCDDFLASTIAISGVRCYTVHWRIIYRTEPIITGNVRRSDGHWGTLHSFFIGCAYFYCRKIILDAVIVKALKLEDLKVLRRSPDLLNNVKIGQGQLQLIMEQILFLPYTFWSSDLNNLMNNPSNSQVISEKKMLR